MSRRPSSFMSRASSQALGEPPEKNCESSATQSAMPNLPSRLQPPRRKRGPRGTIDSSAPMSGPRPCGWGRPIEGNRSWRQCCRCRVKSVGGGCPPPWDLRMRGPDPNSRANRYRYSARSSIEPWRNYRSRRESVGFHRAVARGVPQEDTVVHGACRASERAPRRRIRFGRSQLQVLRQSLARASDSNGGAIRNANTSPKIG